MNILGISCFYHDSAACLVRDGMILAACSEERFDRKKNSSAFPVRAANFCLQKGGITSADLDYIAFYEKPFLKFHRVVSSHLRSFPFSYSNFMRTMPEWLSDRLIMPLVFREKLGSSAKALFIPHHISHAAGSFLASGFDEAAILTVDGVGEWATLTCGTGKGRSIRLTKEIRYPDSLGLVYTAVTAYLGFEALEGEGKVMGLAAYGKPSYLDRFRKIVKVSEDGAFKVDQGYFGNFNSASSMFTRKFTRVFGPPRVPGAPLEPSHMDMAATIQKFTEDTLISIARDLHAKTAMDSLCLAGGVALNCVANARILEETPFKRVFIQPAAGDAGAALGAALYASDCLLSEPAGRVMDHAYLGPDFSDKEIESAVRSAGLKARILNGHDLPEYAAKRLSEDAVVGWMQGRMEFGPRALGNRSILANPANPKMKDILNDKVKHRESFRPYAPVILEHRASEFFEAKQFSPFMLLACRVREEKRNSIPAAVHEDGTARVQTVNRRQNERLCDLLDEFCRITGLPVLLNTSFNVRGEPVVCSPADALRVFTSTRMDALVMGNYILEK